MKKVVINTDLIYPVGSIYMSVNDTEPSKLFGGTWEQIKDDAYLKIVISNGGKLDGTSKDHKIPIESMPSHNHTVKASTNLWALSPGGGSQEFGNGGATSTAITLNNTGGGQAYYPYYYGVYAWVRVS